MKDVVISIRISEQEKEALKAYADKQDLTMSQIARKLIKDFLKEKGEN